MPWNDIPDFTAGQVLTSGTMNDLLENTKIGHVLCTSSTRPSTPDEGTMIYETDTSKVMVWDGSAWVQARLTDDSVATSLLTGTLDYSNAPAGSVIQVGRHGWTNQTSVNGSGAGWVNATGSYYYFTPRFADSTILIQFEWAMAPYYPGVTYAGMSCRGLWNGGVVTFQNNTHEVYVSQVTTNADMYSRTVKSISFVSGTTSSTEIRTQVAAFAATTNARLNQAAQWSSYYTVWEIKS